MKEIGVMGGQRTITFSKLAHGEEERMDSLIGYVVQATP